MKKSIVIALLLVSMSSYAKVWRVNNVSGITADFTTAQLAHDGAGVGDTLYIEPSTTGYGNLSMTKRLTIISVGDFLSENPNAQFTSISSLLGNVTVKGGAAGSVFHCNITDLAIQTDADNVRVERCRITSTAYCLSVGSANNTIILQNYINGSISLQNCNNIIVSNNIVQYGIYLYATASAIISNNVFNSLGNITTPIYNSVFQNNIINKSGSYTFTNCTVKNNLSSNTTLPAGNGNVNSINMANVFVNSSGNDDASFVLKGGSPAIGAGISGVDCGAYGGSSAFVRGLQPAIPAIYQLVVPTTPSGNTMNITFSTKSNN